MIPDFYGSWRQKRDQELSLAQQEAERQQKREMIDDIICFVGIPLLVVAALIAPTVCQVVFGG